MRVTTFLLVALALLASPASLMCHEGHGHEGHSHDHEHSGDVVVLTADNFDGEVSGHPLSLVEFFAPWCGHCKALAPQFATAAVELKDDAMLASVDCTVEKDLCSRFSVKGFPTLKVFRGDAKSPADYQGGRQSDDIVKYMKKQNEPAFLRISSADEATAFFGKSGVLIAAVLGEGEEEAFVSVANALRNDYTFAITRDPSLLSSVVSSPAAGGIYLIKGEGAEREVVPFSGSVSDSSLSSFIGAEAFPLIGEIGPENYQKYLDRGFPLVWIFYNPSAAGDVAALNDVAKENKGKLSMVKLDGVRWAEHAKHFGVPSGVLPALVAEDREKGKNFVFPADKQFGSADVRTFLADFLAGKLVATQKSQEPPADNSAPVKVVVGKTFDEIVMNNSKDVLVEFYAPWCGHCKSLAPKYDELATKLADVDSIVVAKVDATENDTPAKIQGFPTIIFYPAGDKTNPIQYEGDRTVEAMEQWVREHAKSIKGGEHAPPHTHTDL